MSQNCSDAALYNFSPSKYSVLKCEPLLQGLGLIFDPGEGCHGLNILKILKEALM